MSRLAELGLKPDILREAALWGFQQAAQTTSHDPPNLYGILLWAKIVRHLRDLLVPDYGWQPDNRQNYATVVNPDKTVAIAVAGGDWRTGRRDETPSTRSEKGPMTKDAIQSNQMHFHDLFPGFPSAPPPPQTWLLLHHFDEDSEDIRVELSLPSEIDAEGFVRNWRERVIIDLVPLAPIDGSSADDEVDDDDLDQAIPVTRR